MAIYRNTTSEIIRPAIEQFQEEVLNGLSAHPKFLQSKYFYDEEGDKLFQQIMESPDYYLTQCELEIFSQQTKDLIPLSLINDKNFDIIELGAGDATKSIYLLEYLAKLNCEFKYFPIDISGDVIEFLSKQLPLKIPGLEVYGLNGEYTEMIEAANQISKKRKLVLFLGSNIGNFAPEDAVWFLKALHESLAPGDLLLIGFDLKKDPKQILAAYNDREGITKQFNLNLLKRINRELDADFQVDAFDHFPIYNPVNGSCRSYLISLKDQSVQIGIERIRFYQFEPIYMELSQKYSVSQVDALSTETGFKPVAHYYDSKHWFLDALWEKM